MIPFSVPRINQHIIDSVVQALQSGWIGTGPRTRLFEERLATYCNAPQVVCLNSATAGLELMLRWFGVGVGDEVIIPAYTYASTANVVLHCGATPVFADVDEDTFTISVTSVTKLLSPKTKVIISVDFAGLACNYESLFQLINQPQHITQFTPNTAEQGALGRVMLLADSAHGLGATYQGKRLGTAADATVFSFHAAKNLTTAEGGAIALNLPEPFDNSYIYNALRIKSLHGQTVDAFAKVQQGTWKYDVEEPGYKFNMTDLAAAMGLAELDQYEETIAKRMALCNFYIKALQPYPWAIVPVLKTPYANSNGHLFALRIKGITQAQRDKIMAKAYTNGVTLNVHFMPVPQLTAYKNLGYSAAETPMANKAFSTEISLPVYYDLSFDQAQTVANIITHCVEEVLAVNA